MIRVQTDQQKDRSYEEQRTSSLAGDDVESKRIAHEIKRKRPFANAQCGDTTFATDS